MSNSEARELVTGFLQTRFHAAIQGRLRPDEPLLSAGIIDSFGVLELITFLEDTFRITIDPAQHQLIEFDTIDGIVGLVERSRRSS